ncbi:tyrosine-type recombinase/integrase [Gordonia sp. 852002-51296_SCH5728562-b]|uniref:tyrosine-type recombinase/integrase n=1 Tax=Gordonia sp. 852002-51296_SCH5728562-b TaxID=1834101 RepID=UPI0009EF43CA|nr:tyrosine-type recombinase/integrase [Gordonia sp. 852002-51296_SCH5728562-b]
MAKYPGVRKVELRKGVSFEARVAVMVGGKRDYLKQRFPTAAEANEWRQGELARLKAKRTPRSSMTVKDAVESWLASRRINETTKAAYGAALAPVVARFGETRVQTLEAADIEKLIGDLQQAKGPGGRKWARTSINPMLSKLKAVWHDLERRGVIEHDVIQWIEPLRKRDDEEVVEGAMDVSDRLSDPEVTKLLDAHTLTKELELAAAVGGPRSDAVMAVARAPFVELALLGLRRGEIAGLRWSSVDLDAGTIRVAERTRVVVSGRQVDGVSAPIIDRKRGKSRSSTRVLPLPASTLAVLRATKERQRRWRRDATHEGKPWGSGRDGHVLVHAVDGRPVAPRTLDDWWVEALSYAGVTHRRLHASRHTAASRLFAAGLSAAQVAEWLGHSDGGVLALRTYTHVAGEELSAAASVFDRAGGDEKS